MRSKNSNYMNRNGFTLIELILIIILAAIMGTMLVSLIGTNLIKSALPIHLVDDQYKIVQEMEKITSIYRDKIVNNVAPISLDTFKTTYVDTNLYVDAANTGYVTLTGTGGMGVSPYNTTQQALRVTLRSGSQSVQAYFTQ